MSKEHTIFSVDQREGQILPMAGGSYRIVVSGQQTAGEYAMIEMTVPPGAGPGPHAHEDMVETFFVLEGEITFQSELGKFLARPGALVSIPRGGMVHGFKNTSDAPAKLLCTVIPAGLDDLFIELATYMGTTQDTDSEKKAWMKALAEKYNNRFYPEDYFEKHS